ncbi:hypothetical protein PV11_03508 [Exophiala sideris]|uniref:SMP-30/Gluconolactonase/LRE-like region domain-containing protein n=1 Tax=Exophiala sideris TaxID=1016849 RepID=A0A0D1X1F5_9EURO|nr:hypothetical protein PV11_03508 [Exophiala sideris]
MYVLQLGLLSGAIQSLKNPLPSGYNYNESDVVFINQKAANTLPYPFSRDYIGQLWGTTTDNPDVNAELGSIAQASFIAYDRRFFDILGPHPKLEKLFTLPEGTHEAPNYLPAQNKVFVSNFNYTYEYLIDLSSEPPVLENLTTTPELQSVNGGFIYQGKLVVGTDGFRNSTPPGLYLYDPATNHSEVLLNNFRGLRFNTPDDLVVDQYGQVWFVDAPFGYITGVYYGLPQLAPSIYCYNIETGSLSVVDQTIDWPNGIAFSADNKTLYVTDTPIGPGNNTREHAIFAYDVAPPHTLSNKRTFYVPDTFFADGIKVSERGNIFTACASTVDVISPDGDLLGKINVPGHIINNLVFLPNGTIFLTGEGGIWRVRIKEQGIVHY